MNKEIDWKSVLIKTEKKIGVPNNQFYEWKSNEQYGFLLPFKDLKDLDVTLKQIVKWRDFHCLKFSSDEHKNLEKLFEYFPVDQELLLQPKLTNLKGDMHLIGIKIRIGMRFL